MKSTLRLLCLIGLTLSVLTVPIFADNTSILFSVDSSYYYSGGHYSPLDPGEGSRPVLQNGRVLIPIRPVAEALGVDVQWIPESNMIKMTNDNGTVILKLNSKTMMNGNTAVTMDVAPFISGNRTLVPLRVPLEALGFVVKWNPALRSAEVSRNESGFLTPDALGNLKFPDATKLPDYAGVPLFTADTIWNTPIDQLPVHPKSNTYIQSIGASDPVHPDVGTVWDGKDIGFQVNVVPENQQGLPVTFEYADESDPGLYPIPANPLIEAGSDRHILILQQGKNLLYELYAAEKDAKGAWHAGSGVIWNLKTNPQRPTRWTSADAAGLAIFPGLIRYDEVMEKKSINHAFRITLQNIQKSYIAPATHSGGTSMNANLPPMGLRMRLKADFDTSSYSPSIQLILNAMKKYGVVVADVGSDMFISGLHDGRWNDEVLGELKKLKAGDFEAVYTGDAVAY